MKISFQLGVSSRRSILVKFTNIFLFGFLFSNPAFVFAEYWVSIASYKTQLDAETAASIANSQSPYEFQAVPVEVDKEVFFELLPVLLTLCVMLKMLKPKRKLLV